MTIIEKSLLALEWSKIKDKLAELATSSLGRDEVLSLPLENEEAIIIQRLRETAELKQLIQEEGELPLDDDIYDLRPFILRIEKEGVLNGQELLKVYRTLVVCYRIKTFFVPKRGSYPHLFEMIFPLTDLRDLRRRLASCIDESGELADSASHLLQKLRRQVYSLQQLIKDKLNSILNSPQYSNILQEEYFTIRGNRYVIPIKTEARPKIVGIVHDSSVSGATIYIEPQELVDLNNRLRMAELELEHETHRILRELSLLVADYIPEIMVNLEVLSHFDLTLSKARLGIMLSGHAPRINKQGKVGLFRVRHPLLILNQEEVIPNDISLGGAHQGIIITGPNAGGKTIMLKTVGLCALMIKAGLLIPASADSEMAIFPEIYADIGDPQSVESNLSTFSGHLSNIIEITEKASPGSLVLLDEIVTSTDPQEGEALAQAIIENLLALNTYLIVTTHYNHLKTLSSQNSHIVDAGMEFDLQGLQPTFRLLIGTPGRSYGMEIAHRLGLSQEVCSRAKDLWGSQPRAIDTLLGQLEEQRQAMERKTEELSRSKEEADSLREQVRKELDKIKNEKEKITLDFHQELSEELNQAKKKINILLENIKQERRRENIRTAQQELSKIDQEIKSSRPVWPPSSLSISSLNNCHEGDEIEIISLQQRGVLLEGPAGKERVGVQVGPIKVVVKTTDLLPLKAEPKKLRPRRRPPARPELTATASALPSPGPENSCDLRGLTVEEARTKSDSFLDKAILQNIPYVYLIHGHGTGTLKKALRAYLTDSSYVRNFRPGKPQEGGDGVTVVELK
jgi:DNA mismatch repair protein MutS2